MILTLPKRNLHLLTSNHAGPSPSCQVIKPAAGREKLSHIHLRASNDLNTRVQTATLKGIK
jgi:hypothetical protein